MQRSWTTTLVKATWRAKKLQVPSRVLKGDNYGTYAQNPNLRSLIAANVSKKAGLSLQAPLLITDRRFKKFIPRAWCISTTPPSQSVVWSCFAAHNRDVMVRISSGDCRRGEGGHQDIRRTAQGRNPARGRTASPGNVTSRLIKRLFKSAQSSASSMAVEVGPDVERDRDGTCGLQMWL